MLSPANERARVLAIKDAATAAVPSDAELRAEAKALGIELSPSRRELRRLYDDIALQAALGWEPPPKSTPLATESRRSERELRRQSREIQLQAAFGWEPLPESPKRAKASAVRQQARDEMLALLTHPDAQAGNR